MPRALVVFAAILVFAASDSFGGHSRIDQEQPAANNTNTWSVGWVSMTSKSGQMLAQVFTPALSGTLNHVTLPIACGATATLTVSIQTVAGGVPSGTVLASETISGSLYPQYTAPYSAVPAPGFRLAQFFTPTHIQAGMQYAIVLAASGNCAIFHAPDGDSYVGGRAYYNSPLSRAPGWHPIGAPNGPSDDLPFQTFVEPDPEPIE